MTTAHFQPLTWRSWHRLTGWMIGILRVYAPGDRYPLSPYKFTATVVIRRHIATIHGMRLSGIGWRDVQALDRELGLHGVTLATWTHNNKRHNYTLRG